MSQSEKAIASLLTASVIFFSWCSAQSNTLSLTSTHVLSPLALFHRCYSHLTGGRLPRNHRFRSQVISGAKKPIDACMEILDNALLSESGSNEGRPLAETSGAELLSEARVVLQQMNDLHRSFFPNDNLSRSVITGDLDRTRELYDESESALHMTRALLSQNIPFSHIVTSNFAIEAIRSRGESYGDKKYNFDTQAYVDRPTEERLKHLSKPNNTTGTEVMLNAQMVQEGNLLGMKPMNLNSSKTNQVVNSPNSIYFPHLFSYIHYEQPLRINESLGAGIIGTKSYLLLNLGRPDMFTSDGGFRLSRRWSKAVLKDMLCRDLPSLRTSDAIPFVQRNPTSATPSFRTNHNCMSCHASMDPMAAAIRNVSYVTRLAVTHIDVWAAPTVTAKPREAGLVDEDPDFFRRPTNGKLFFRSYDGTLVSEGVDGLPQLGQAIAATNDLYVCMASRYYHYFTGVRANLQDIGDSSQQPLTPIDLLYRSEVVDLGLKLKADKNQSLRSLIRNIMTSPVYQTEALRIPAGNQE